MFFSSSFSRRLSLFLITFFMGSALGFAQVPVDSIVERTLRAFGGQDKFDNIEVLYKEGDIMVGVAGGDVSEDAKRKIRMWWVPFKGIKTEIEEVNKNIAGSIFTPTHANRYDVILKTGEVDQFEQVQPYEVKTTDMMYSKFSFIPEFCLNDYNTPRNTTLNGYEQVDGKRCYKLVHKGASVIFIDEDTYLPVKYVQVYKDMKDDKSSFIEYYFSDYRKTASGLITPFVIEQMKKGNDIPIVYRFTKIETNGNLPREEALDVASYKAKNAEYLQKHYAKIEKEQAQGKRARGASVGGVVVKKKRVDTSSKSAAITNIQQDKPITDNAPSAQKVDDKKASRNARVGKSKKETSKKRVTPAPETQPDAKETKKETKKKTKTKKKKKKEK